MAALTLVSLLALGRTGEAGAQSAVKVKMVDSLFKPKAVAVKRGTTVKWKNAGQLDHNVKGSGFASKTVAPGGGYAFRFSKAGTYKYLCTIHPTTMKGTVSVSK